MLTCSKSLRIYGPLDGAPTHIIIRHLLQRTWPNGVFRSLACRELLVPLEVAFTRRCVAAEWTQDVVRPQWRSVAARSDVVRQRRRLRALKLWSTLHRHLSPFFTSFSILFSPLQLISWCNKSWWSWRKKDKVRKREKLLREPILGQQETACIIMWSNDVSWGVIEICVSFFKCNLED